MVSPRSCSDTDRRRNHSKCFVAGQQSSIAAIYVGDQWRIASRLTLNYGLRFEQMGPWSERFDRLAVLLPSEANPVPRPRRTCRSKASSGLVNSPDRPSRNNRISTIWFSPRFGFAYRLNNKTVIRTGYGIFWIPTMLPSTSARTTMPLTRIHPFVGTNDGSVTPFNRLSNPFPNGIIPAPGHNPNFQQLFLGQGFSGAPSPRPAGTRNSGTSMCSASCPAALPSTVAYAGSKGSHLPGPNSRSTSFPMSS